MLYTVAQKIPHSNHRKTKRKHCYDMICDAYTGWAKTSTLKSTSAVKYGGVSYIYVVASGRADTEAALRGAVHTP